MKAIIAAACGLGVLLGPLVTIARADLSAEQVKTAIDRGIQYLEGSQQSNGDWSDYSGQPGGIGALSTLALLNAGVDPKDEHIQLALKYLRKLPHEDSMRHNYVVSLQTMVLCRAEPENDQALIADNVRWLQQTQIRGGGMRNGAWSYPQGAGDGSNSQFALLALYEAERLAESGRLNVTISADTWRRAQDYWKNAQWTKPPDYGAWGYYPPSLPGTGSMTCAGIASLMISSDVIHQADSQVVGDRIDCCGARSDDEIGRRVEDGVEWLRQHYSIERNPGSVAELWHLYYLYALERVGRLTARRFIGEHDWYREGANFLVHRQDTLSGFWQGGNHAEDNRDVATSLALLFLSKGRRPVLMTKAKFGSGHQGIGQRPEEWWNRRRHDVDNMTSYVELRWKRELTWQVVDIEQASIDDLLQAPVLYISGGHDMLPTEEDEQAKLAEKIRGYIDRGGFLFAEADCCSTGFDDGFRKLMGKVFPEPEYRLKPLDASHPIWHYDEKVDADQLRPLLGIDFGCRTSVVYAPNDPPRPSLSCLWELSRTGQREPFPDAVQTQIRGGCSIGINILAYATNREVKWKYDIPESMAESDKPDKVDRNKLYVVKLQHPGGCDAAPRALANLMEQAARNMKLRVDIHPKLISIQSPALFDYPIVFMHGRNNFTLTDGERKQLKTYIERGGLLFGDAICANKAFADSFRREMAIMFPKNPLEDIPATAPIWTDKYGGFNLATVSRRDPQPARSGGPLEAVVRKVPPELLGIKLGDRYGVIFSEFDLSCALEKHDSLECKGYIREDAAKIGLNVLLYGMQQ